LAAPNPDDFMDLDVPAGPLVDDDWNDPSHGMNFVNILDHGPEWGNAVAEEAVCPAPCMMKATRTAYRGLEGTVLYYI
jgi:hypothetical protein